MATPNETKETFDESQIPERDTELIYPGYFAEATKGLAKGNKRMIDAALAWKRPDTDELEV